MQTQEQKDLERMKECRFAILPTRIVKEEKETDTEEGAERKYSVQCQVCGRIGVTSLSEMEKHKAWHEEQMKEKEKAREEMPVEVQMEELPEEQ